MLVSTPGKTTGASMIRSRELIWYEDDRHGGDGGRYFRRRSCRSTIERGRSTRPAAFPGYPEVGLDLWTKSRHLLCCRTERASSGLGASPSDRHGSRRERGRRYRRTPPFDSEPVEQSTRTPFVPTPFRRRSMSRHADTGAIYGIWGPGSPVGIIGVEGVQRFGSHFEIATGRVRRGSRRFGASRWTRARFQWAFMPRFRFGDDARAFTMGAGVSGGQWETAGSPSALKIPALPLGQPATSSGATSRSATSTGGRADMRLFRGVRPWLRQRFQSAVLGVGLGYAF